MHIYVRVSNICPRVELLVIATANLKKTETASYFTSKRSVSSGIKENYNLGQISYGKTIGKSREQRRGALF